MRFKGNGFLFTSSSFFFSMGNVIKELKRLYFPLISPTYGLNCTHTTHDNKMEKEFNVEKIFFCDL